MKREFDCDPAWNWRIEKNRITLRMRYSIQAADGVVSRAPLPPYIRVSRTALSHSVVLRTLGRGVLSFISPLFHIWVLSFEIIEKTTRVLRKLTTRLVSPRQFSRLFLIVVKLEQTCSNSDFLQWNFDFQTLDKTRGRFQVCGCVVHLASRTQGSREKRQVVGDNADRHTETQYNNQKTPKNFGHFFVHLREPPLGISFSLRVLLFLSFSLLVWRCVCVCQSVVVGERAAVDDGKFCSFFSSVPNGLLTLLFFFRSLTRWWWFFWR